MASTPDEPWWVEHPELLDDVLARVAARGWAPDVVQDRERETVTLTIRGLPSPPSELTVVLPPAYPTVPAPIKGPPGLAEHIHLVDGTLCLPSHLTDAVDLIDAALHLYDRGKDGAAALEALGGGSAEPRSGFMPMRARHAVSLAVDIPPGAWGQLTFAGTTSRDSLQGTLLRATDADSDLRYQLEGSLRENLALTTDGLKRHDFLWWRTDDQRYPVDANELLTFWRDGLPAAAQRMLSAYHQRRRPSRKGRGGRGARGVLMYGLVVPEEGPAHHQWHERLLVIATFDERAIHAFPVSTFAETGERIPDVGELRNKTVAVAGLGMLGGNLAIDLGRSGVGSLRLADHETVVLGNLVRQPYDYDDVGENKTDALRSHLQRAAPMCAVPIEHLLHKRFGHTATRAETRRWLEGCDLLIMATGDHNAELHLCEIAHDLGIPVVSGWVSLGIWGALSLRTEWGQSGCRWCLDQRHDELAVLAEQEGASELYTRGCGYPTFPGNVIDGRIATSIIGRMAIDSLLGQASEGDLAVVTMQTSAGRVGPQTAYSTLPPDPTCPICAR